MHFDENGTPFFSDHGPSFFSKTYPTREYRASASLPGGRFAEAINSAGKTYDIDPTLLKCVIAAESDFNKYAISRKGAHGLMQLTLPTAFMYNVKNVYDPLENINGGAKHLKYLLRKFNGNLRLALAAYNAGETAVIKYSGVPPYPETIQYVDKVMGYYGQGGKIAAYTKHKNAKYYVYHGLNGSILITDTPKKLGDNSKALTMDNP